jgi:hypothetical protein
MGLEEWIAKVKKMTPEERLATVTLDDVRFYDSSVVLSWSGIMGFGQYAIELSREVEIDKDSGEEETKSYSLVGNSECMDLHNENKMFLRHLLKLFADKVDLSAERHYDAEWREQN